MNKTLPGQTYKIVRRRVGILGVSISRNRALAGEPYPTKFPGNNIQTSLVKQATALLRESLCKRLVAAQRRTLQQDTLQAMEAVGIRWLTQTL